MAAVGPRLVLGLAVAGLALVGSSLAACPKTTGTGGLGAVPAASAPVGTASSPSAPTTDAPAESPSTPAPPASATPCTVKQVKVSVVDPDDGAAGTIIQRFVLTNTSTKKCWMNKTPFVAPYGPLKQGSTTVEATLEVTVTSIQSNIGQLGAAGRKEVL